MHIGLIGGIGPAATVVYYQRLCAAMRARDKPLDCTIVQADVQTLISHVTADDRVSQAKIYAELLGRLQAAGAECAAITSLGGHFCFAETAAISPIPLISAIAPLDTYFADQGMKTVGLLGTNVVMQTRLYGQLHRTLPLIPDNRAEIGTLYQEVAVSGVCTDEQQQVFLAAGRALMAAGADCVVLAGTDLNLAFDGSDTGYPVIDALDIHVAALAALAANETPLP